MHHTFTRICTCALAIAAVLFIGSQASAQGQGGPAVTVVNTPLPVMVTNQAIPGTPVAFSLKNGAAFTVPMGKRFVIEYVSGECLSLSNPVPIPEISVVTSGVLNDHTIAIPFNPNPSISPLVWQVGHLVKLYADPGTKVTLTMNRGSCVLLFSGLLVNL